MTSKTLKTAAALAAAALISPDQKDEIDAVAARYAVAVTPDLVDLVDRDDPDDPIARQFVPDGRELRDMPEERSDPIGDQRRSPLKGIVHRYPDRVLLTPIHVCAVYCRFCFRRETVGPGSETLTGPELTAALDYIRGCPAIWEVIVTGGDPFLLSPRRLGALVRALDAIPHLGAIRFHTRVPIAQPGRVGAELLASLRSAKALWIAIHANHAREFGPAQRSALARLSGAGIPLLGQSVLLAGVNDNAATLEALFRVMVANRVKPYYLHHPDLARGTAHFRGGIGAGQDLMRQMRGRVSGLCQPTYMLDLPGGHGKVPIGPVYADRDGEGWRITDPQGRNHAYPPVGGDAE